MISAKIVADSINDFGDRLTTFVITFPRYLLAEFNTHRMFSRNSSSSRARPHSVLLQEVQRSPFIPIKWMKQHQTMQGTEYFTDQKSIEQLTQKWLSARDSAVAASKQFDDIETLGHNKPIGLTKQLSNRILEPFLMHTVIVTATEFENFFALRAQAAADIHIQDLAQKMLDEYNATSPTLLQAGEWHIPFGDQMDAARLQQLDEADQTICKVKIASARCARISYIPFGEENSYDYKKDIALHDRLATDGHFSPLEHCARSMNQDEYVMYVRTNSTTKQIEKGWCGNFRGFIQYRKLFADENRGDARVTKKRKEKS